MTRLAVLSCIALGCCVHAASAQERTHPPGILAPNAPGQGSPTLPRIERDDFVLTPVADFQLQARVLARRDYDSGIEAPLSPMDLVLGWGRMSDTTILRQVEIVQANRWYSFVSPRFSPISEQEIRTSSANMHMIAGNDFVLRQLQALQPGDLIGVSGYLVNAERARDGFRWRTSTTREDSGAGSCEIVFITSMRAW